MKIDPYIFPMMSMIISDGKEHAENTGKKPDLVGLSENPPQKHKKSIFSKIAKEICLILKIWTTQYAWMLYLARGDLLFPHYLVSSSNGVSHFVLHSGWPWTSLSVSYPFLLQIFTAVKPMISRFCTMKLWALPNLALKHGGGSLPGWSIKLRDDSTITIS